MNGTDEAGYGDLTMTVRWFAGLDSLELKEIVVDDTSRTGSAPLDAVDIVTGLRMRIAIFVRCSDDQVIGVTELREHLLGK
jgi:hypothetical protein